MINLLMQISRERKAGELAIFSFLYRMLDFAIAGIFRAKLSMHDIKLLVLKE